MGEITVALVGGSEFDRQRSVEVGVRVQAAGVLILRYGLALHCRVMYREFDQSPTKDVVLLGAALWSLGEAMTATKEPAPEA